MNKFRICAVFSIMLSFGGIALMNTEKMLGITIMAIGLVSTVIFLTKAKKEEKHSGPKTSNRNTPKREKRTILQYLIQKIKENQVQEIPQGPKSQKSILQNLIGHLKEKPATNEEIRQLRLEAEKYRLKADIAKSKAAISGSKGVKFSLGGSGLSESSQKDGSCNL